MSSEPGGTSRRMAYCTGSTLPTRSQRATRSKSANTSSGRVHGVKGSSEGRGSIPAAAQHRHGVGLLVGGVALVELLEDVVAGRLERRHREEAPGRPQARPQLDVAQDVLDLDGDVEGQLGKRTVDGVDRPHRMVGPVEEVGVTEGDVAGPQRHELRHVGHDDVLAHEAGASVVDHGHRTVPAPVGAPVARLHVPGQPALPPEVEVGVALQGRQEPARREPEASPTELDHGRGPHRADGRPGPGDPEARASAQATSRGSYSPVMARSATGADPSAPSSPA